MESLNKLKSSLPFFTLIFISLGYIKVYSRYEYIGIDIVNYLDFSEILLLFIKEIILGFFILIFLVFIYSLLNKRLQRLEKNRLIRLKKANKYRKFWLHIKAILPFGLLTFLIYLFHFLYDYNIILEQGEKAYRIHYGLSYAFTIMITFTGLLFILNIIEFNIKNIDPKIKSRIKYLILTYSVISMIVYFLNQAVSYRDMARGDKNVHIITKDVNVSTDAHMPYMGETRNFIFVFDKHNCETIVINKKDIEKLSYGFNQKLHD